MKLFINRIKYRMQILLHKLGWHISKYHEAKVEGDIYEIQKYLLGGQDVKEVFDVGAWIGNTAESYRQHFPAATIHAFEPFPESFQKLKIKINNSSHIKVNQLAVSDQIGTVSFYSNKVETTNSLLPSETTHSEKDFFRDTVDEITVDSITIDDYCRKNDIKHIDIMKLDVQGGELNVFKGANKLLASNSIDIIFCEVNFLAQYKNSPLYHDIANYLYAFDYKLYNLYDLNTNERGELMWGDAIFYSNSAYNKMKRN